MLYMTGDDSQKLMAFDSTRFPSFFFDSRKLVSTTKCEQKAGQAFSHRSEPRF